MRKDDKSFWENCNLVPELSHGKHLLRFDQLAELTLDDDLDIGSECAERVLQRHGVRARVISLGASDQQRRRVEDIIDVHPSALGERPSVDPPRHARLRRRGERHLDGDGAASAHDQRLRVQILVRERRRHLDGESSGRAVALHEDRVVAAVATVDAGDGEPVSAADRGDVVLGRRVDLNAVLQPLHARLVGADLALEHGAVTEPRHLHVGQRPREVDRLHWRHTTRGFTTWTQHCTVIMRFSSSANSRIAERCAVQAIH